jgi:hypothetical protein
LSRADRERQSSFDFVHRFDEARMLMCEVFPREECSPTRESTAGSCTISRHIRTLMIGSAIVGPPDQHSGRDAPIDRAYLHDVKRGADI